MYHKILFISVTLIFLIETLINLHIICHVLIDLDIFSLFFFLAGDVAQVLNCCSLLRGDLRRPTCYTPVSVHNSRGFCTL